MPNDEFWQQPQQQQQHSNSGLNSTFGKSPQASETRILLLLGQSQQRNFPQYAYLQLGVNDQLRIISTWSSHIPCRKQLRHTLEACSQ